jgi:hypothetical protein
MAILQVYKGIQQEAETQSQVPSILIENNLLFDVCVRLLRWTQITSL